MRLYAILALTFFTFFLNITTKGQAPSTCFEIESILVDACDPNNIEGENEMVRFYVGPTDLNVSDMTVDWPSNSYQGICQNATTANKVNQLNNSITGCGFLKEPVGGVLPAESKVMLITSTNFNVAANSFENLNDTLIVIFQCAGNTQGHFANYNSNAGLRTLEITFSSPGSCSDQVTYERSDLVNIFGTTGGSTDDRNGSTVEFDWNGNPTYVNYGCQAPIEIATVEINESSPSICPGDTIDLSATIQGDFQSILWTGGQGTFSTPNNDVTQYFSSNSDNTPFNIYLNGITTCNDTIKDTLLIQMSTSGASVSISSISTELCTGDSIELIANGNGNYTWSTGSNDNSIFVTQAGTYSVNSVTGCGNATDSIVITEVNTFTMSLSASDTLICEGENAILTASGAPNYNWFNNATDSIQTITATGDYYVIGFNSCFTDSQSIYVEVIPNFSLNISASNTSICNGETATLTATGAPNYNWFNNSTDTFETVSSEGNYYVIGYNECFSDSQSIFISVEDSFNMMLSASDTSLCEGEIATLSVTGAPNQTWFNNTTGSTTTVSNTGNYYVIGYNNCFTDSQSVTLNVTQDFTLNISSSNPALLICGTEIITLTASGGPNYTWNTNATSSSIDVTTAGTYTVTSSNECFNYSESITINNGAEPEVTIMGDSILCDGEVISLNASGADTYIWSTGEQTSTIAISSEQGIYVIGSNNCGTDSAYFSITDHSVIANFNSNYSSGMNAPVTINFQNSSTNANSFSWNFGDGNTSSAIQPSHNFTSDGEYLITLTASNDYCQNTFQDSYIFELPTSIFIPNVFTPNGDSINDYFLIEGHNIGTLSCKIFNRWGQQIYSWDNLDGKWDGTYEGTLVSDGTYFYIVKVIWKNDETETFTGPITILKD